MEFQLQSVLSELITYQSELAFFVLITIFVFEDFDFRLVQSFNCLGIFRRVTITTNGSMRIKLSLVLAREREREGEKKITFIQKYFVH